MLSLIELERVASVLSESLVGGRIERWLEPSSGRIAFSIYRHAERRADGDEKRKCVIELDARPEIGHVALLSRISPVQFGLSIGLSVIVASLILSVCRPRHCAPAPGLSSVTGLVSGLMNGAFAIPGPPVIIYAMATQPDPARGRALLMTFFLFSALLALAFYSVAGFVTASSPWLFLAAFPAMYVGDKLGYYLFRRFGAALYRRVALVVLFAVGFGITAKTLFWS